MCSVRRVAVLALVAALVAMLGVLRPAMETPRTQADLAAPGGIAALPSAAPAIPSQTGQNVPAVIGTGQPGIVAIFCFARILPVQAGPCADLDEDGRGTITFEIGRLYPDESPSGLTFDATGTRELVVSDNGGGDLDAGVGVVTVRVNAAAATQGATQGVNEIVEIKATDESGEVRSVQMVVIDTILAWGPTGPLSTAAQNQPLFVSYRCDVTGRSPLVEGTLPWAIDPDGDSSQGLDDMYDGLYGQAYGTLAPGLGYGSNTPDGDLDLPDVWCGGNTPSSLFDDFVDYETELGLFTVDPIAWSLRDGALGAGLSNVFLAPIVDTDCDEGKSVNVFDVDALTFWSLWLTSGFTLPEGGCDMDGWRNSVTTAVLLGNGEVGTSAITAQQGGGVSPARTVYATFVGEPAISLFLEAPASMGVEGGQFTAVLVDSSFRPVADKTISCTVDPVDAGFIIVPQTGTTGTITGDLPGQVVMTIVPTPSAVVEGGTIAVICKVDSQPSVRAVAVVTLAAFETESVDLLAGCNPVSATWPDGTAIDTVVAAVAPAEALDAIWKFDPESGMWQGFSPAAPEASDLMSVDELDAIFVCMNAPGTISRPVI